MQLLISVTSAAEATAALAGGADIIDLKNPAEGALGTAPVAALQAVCGLVSLPQLTSAALGDSGSAAGTLALAAYGAATFGVRYVKLGLGDITPEAAIPLLQLVQASARLANPNCGLIAVGYADGAEIGVLPWQSMPEIAHSAAIAGCMIDTALKTGRRLFDYCAESELKLWLGECRRAGLIGALAGALTTADLPAVRRLAPDVVGFRGAACAGDRVNGQVQPERVAQLRAGLFC